MARLLVIVVVILVVAFLAYSWFDSRISLDHTQQELKSRAEHIKLLHKLLFELGNNRSKAEILQLAEKFRNEGHIVKSERNDEIEIDGLILYFKSDSLVKVGSFNEY